jgi:hypothetical protein
VAVTDHIESPVVEINGVGVDLAFGGGLIMWMINKLQSFPFPPFQTFSKRGRAGSVREKDQIISFDRNFSKSLQK